MMLWEKTVREHLGKDVFRVRTLTELDLTVLSDFGPHFIFFLIGRGKFRGKSMKGLSV